MHKVVYVLTDAMLKAESSRVLGGPPCLASILFANVMCADYLILVP